MLGPRDPQAWARAQDVLETFSNMRSFVSGDGAARVGADYWFRASERRVRGEVVFGPLAEGMPGHVHGAAIVGVFDEGLGLLAWYLGYRVVTSDIRTRFLQAVPLGTQAHLDGQLEEIEGWEIRGRATLRNAAGEACAVVQATFVEVEPGWVTEFARTNAMRRQAQPASWPPGTAETGS